MHFRQQIRNRVTRFGGGGGTRKGEYDQRNVKMRANNEEVNEKQMRILII